MALDAGAPVDTFVTDEAPTRGLGAILASTGHERHALPLARVTIAATVADRIAEVTITQVSRMNRSNPPAALNICPSAASTRSITGSAA